MIHHYVKDDLSGDHWATNTNGYGKVLVQLQQGHDYIRMMLTPEQAQHMAEEILKSVERASRQESLEDSCKKHGLDPNIKEQKAR